MAILSDGLPRFLTQNYIILENSKAECKICKKQICMVNWNSLTLHLNNHITIEKSYKAKSYNSIWQYFSKFEGRAKCVICGSIISVATKLIIHLERKHPEIANLINAQKRTIKEITKLRDLNPYYRYLNKFKVQCKLCNKIISSDIKRHLEKIHSHNIMRKKKIYNWIWQYVKIESHDNRIKCNICDSTYTLSSRSIDNLRSHLSRCHNINAQSKIDENTKENITHKAVIRQLETKEDVADTSIYHIVPCSKSEENEEGKCRFYQINACSTSDENTEENKTDRAMKKLIIREDIIDINSHQSILYSKLKENKENNWSSTNSSYINFYGQILITEGDKVYTVL